MQFPETLGLSGLGAVSLNWQFSEHTRALSWAGDDQKPDPFLYFSEYLGRMSTQIQIYVTKVGGVPHFHCSKPSCVRTCLPGGAAQSVFTSCLDLP